MSKKSMLHELLAVEGDLNGTFRKIIAETRNTFSKKESLFSGSLRTLHMFADETSDEDFPIERQELSTTVGAKLKYAAGHITKYFDAVLQKESTNQTAIADVVINGKSIIEGAPATFLLAMEHRLKEVREMYAAIPTLTPGIKWIKDEDNEKGVFITEHPEKTFKTESVYIPQVLYPATPEHPAQVDKIKEVKNTGEYSKTNWSGKVTPIEKSNALERLDKVIRAVKRARMQANRVEVIRKNFGTELMKYINGNI